MSDFYITQSASRPMSKGITKTGKRLNAKNVRDRINNRTNEKNEDVRIERPKRKRDGHERHEEPGMN